MSPISLKIQKQRGSASSKQAKQPKVDAKRKVSKKAEKEREREKVWKRWESLLKGTGLYALTLVRLPPSFEGFRKLKEYSVGFAGRVLWLEDVVGRRYYFWEEVPLTEEEVRAFQLIFEFIRRNAYYLSQLVKGGETIRGLVEGIARKLDLGLSDESLGRIYYYVSRDLVGHGALQVPMEDDMVEEITVNAPNSPVKVITKDLPGVWQDTNLVFNPVDLKLYATRLAARYGEPLTGVKPYAEIIVEGGHRVVITGEEITRSGVSITVRKFPRSPYTMVHLLKRGMLDVATASYLTALAESLRFVVYAGPTGSGKTTLMTATVQALNPNWKVVTVEDVPELDLRGRLNWVSLVAKETFGKSTQEVMALLIRLALRMKPQLLLYGEVRAPWELGTLVNAARTGHGALTTLHSDTPQSLTLFINMSLKEAFGEMATHMMDIYELFSAIVFVREVEGVGRIVTNVYEPVPGKEGVEFQKLVEHRGGFWLPGTVEGILSASKVTVNALRSVGRYDDFARYLNFFQGFYTLMSVVSSRDAKWLDVGNYVLANLYLRVQEARGEGVLHNFLDRLGSVSGIESVSRELSDGVHTLLSLGPRFEVQ